MNNKHRYATSSEEVHHRSIQGTKALKIPTTETEKYWSFNIVVQAPGPYPDDKQPIICGALGVFAAAVSLGTCSGL